MGGSLQDSNIDFLNIEGNKRPSSPQPNPNVATGGIKTSSTTPRSPTGTKQLIKEFNDRIAEHQNRGNVNPTPPSNKNTPSRQNSQGNRESFPSLPSQDQNKKSGPWNSQNNPTGNANLPQGTTNPPGSNNQWGPQSRNQNRQQNRDFPGLPNSAGSTLPNSASSTVQPSTPKSWSSVVSSNNKPGGSNPPPTGFQPTSVKSSATLQPIVPGAPLPPVQSTTPVVEVISDSELKTLSENLLKKDNNNAAKYITVNYQGRTSSFSKDDLAPQP